MRNYLIFFISIILLISLTGCPDEFPPDGAELTIINNSDEDIIWFNVDHIITSDTNYMVETLPWGNNIDNYIITKGNSFSDTFLLGNIKYLLEEGWMQYYLLNYDTVLTVPWERIRDENIILKKVYFETWEDLEACNFTITYP
ncbi:MAG: hypothetical protein GQ564_18255 [Bacteroidales bacterium]|nr:hypothetical protein [Bacteroidales bacterium]